MTERQTAERLEAIEQKIDVILQEIELQRRHRREMEDLKDDLMRVGKDFYQTAVVELDQIHDQFSTVELAHLGKKLLRNVGTMTHVVEQLESLRDFLEDATPLARDSFIDLMNKLDVLDRKGYFAFLREIGSMVDTIVTSFTPQDVRNLGENIVTILNTVKNLTQPDVLQSINNAVSVYKKLDITVTEEVGLWRLMNELRSPEARKGLAFAVAFLKNLGAPAENTSLAVSQRT
jgi:uncharacterized protein YjgD (DUF1641 family)